MINIEENQTSLVRVFTGIYKNVNANKQKKIDNQYQATTTREPTSLGQKGRT